MRRLFAWALVLVSFTMLLAGCTKVANGEGNGTSPAAGVFMTLNEHGQYTGFASLPEKFSLDEATNSGWMVMGGLEGVTGQEEVWKQFVDAAEKGNNARLRIAHFFTDEPSSPYYNDLFFQDGKYYIFDSTAETHQPEPFSYLLTLQGRMRNSMKDNEIVVLTNDAMLTFDKVITALTSSNTEVIHSISPYAMVRWNVN